jgi:hypothetical protein
MARERRPWPGAHAPVALVLLFLVAGAAAAEAFATRPPREKGWAPWLALAGAPSDPSPRVAVERLTSGLSTLGSVLNGLSADSETRAFFAKVLEQLESMDLEALYATLPEEDGPWRRVRFTGQRDGEAYRVATVPQADPCACIPDGKLGGRFGDLAVSFRSRPAAAANGGTNGNYVGQARSGLGLGDARWSSMVEAVVEAVQITELGAPDLAKTLPAAARPALATRSRVIADNPRLGPEDVEAMGVFAEAFPAFYAHLREMYRVDDVLVWDPLGNAPYRQLRFMLGVRREAMKESYPALLKFFEGLGPLARGQIDVLDEKGRTLFGFRFSTQDLAVELRAFVREGRILPVDGGVVLVDEGVDLREVKTSRHTLHGAFSFDMNGITTDIRDLDAKVVYERKADESMELHYALDKEPVVQVSGSAFGVVPTWAIDAVIPGNMEDLTREFLRTVTRGNDGKGLDLAIRVQRGQRTSVLETEGSAEGLNNALVRIAFKIARHKLIPSDEALDDIGRALRGAHAAFGKDLVRFAETIK